MSPLTNGVSAPSGVSLADLVEQLTARLQAGEDIDSAAVVAAHPQHADRLSGLLPTLRAAAALGGSGDLSGDDPLPNAELGDFRIVRQVGRGGMGVVYEAEQLSLRRRVALKVLPFAATMDPKQLQRFRNEALAAASLHHEHIVPVHAVGCERGVHYYAMQFIDGHTLADRITARSGSVRPAVGDVNHDFERGGDALTPPVAALSTRPDLAAGRAAFRQVADWIAQAADALEYAHSMGIVHRDVKPGNLMVDGGGKLWVADFGLARFGADAGLTMTGDVLGTLRYLAPEQALAKHDLVDHRADVYGLGPTLYELLTGKQAIGGEHKAEMLRHIAFEEPVAPRKLAKAIPAELETITLKCLAKNPAERYPSAGELAEDLRRFLHDTPIKARPPGLRERAAKWARRHQGFVRAAFAMLVLAVIGLSLSTWLIWREKEATRRAKEFAVEQAGIARAVEGFLFNDLLDQADSLEQADGGFTAVPNLTVKDAVDRAAAQIEGKFADRPLVAAAVHSAVGKAYTSVGDYPSAIRHLQAARDLHVAGFGPDHPETLRTLLRLANAYSHAGRDAEALPIYEHVRDVQTATLGPDHPDTLSTMNRLSYAYGLAGKTDLALALGEQTVAAMKAKLGPNDPQTLTAMNTLAIGYLSPGRTDPAKLALALKLFKDCLEASTATQGPDHPGTFLAMNNLAYAFDTAGKPDLALPLFEKALAGQRAKLGSDHPETLMTMNSLANVYKKLGKQDEALKLLEEAFAAAKIKLGPEHRKTLLIVDNLAASYRNAGRWDLALPLDRLTLGSLMAKFGRDHPATLTALNNVGTGYLATEKPELAVPKFQQALDAARAMPGLDPSETLKGLHNLAAAYHAAGNLDMAVRIFGECLAGCEAKLGPEHPYTLMTMDRLAVANWNAGKFDRSIPLLEETLKRREKKQGRDNPETVETMANLGINYRDAGRLPEGIALLQESLSRSKPKSESTMNELGVALLSASRWAEAEALLRDLIPGREKSHPDSWSTFLPESETGERPARPEKVRRRRAAPFGGLRGDVETSGQNVRRPQSSRVRSHEVAGRSLRRYGPAGQGRGVAKETGRAAGSRRNETIGWAPPTDLRRGGRCPPY